MILPRPVQATFDACCVPGLGHSSSKNSRKQIYPCAEAVYTKAEGGG